MARDGDGTVPANERPWRSVLVDETGARLNPRPTAPGYQTAIAVDADGQPSPSGVQELHCDRLGRIRVRLHWQLRVRPGAVGR
ncbi:hypothetical protein H0E84_19165 [Luteimonas sp. SJ-92]|uniref:Uncharacterized protein n=1 Tax=Luteimonas salinisoli TaxID=2752307 RepID=A0A853JJ61_9GAMM|nr:hypothetical protein [Luteimonas salinisoli]NZA28498.1 hypothetical protein [Luteimonas salinisoli]